MITTDFYEFLNEGKKRKSEKSAIVDRYKEYNDKIQDKKDELNKIYKSDDNIEIKTIRLNIKRLEISMAEKELDIVRMRDRKLRYKHDLEHAEQKEKAKKKK